MSKDPYQTLGVSKTATADEIKSAYRKMAKQYHPDQNPGDQNAEAKFKEINSAYETLSDPNKKANYDRFGSADGPQGFGGGGGFGGFSNGGMRFDFGDFGDISDIFNMFTGGGGSTRRSSRGNDIHANINLTFEESCLGVKKTINFSRMEKCGDCNGTGAKDGTDVEVCSYCGGSGKVRSGRGFGGFSVVTPCSACNATGRIVKNKCNSCGGKGAQKRAVSYEVSVPAGIANGQTLNLAGEGDCAMGGPDGISGALLIAVRVAAHPLLVRDGFDLYLELPISFTQAILGDKVQIPTIDGTTELTIPPYTQNGSRHILRGKGVKRLKQMGYGDLIVKILVEMPKHIDRKTVEIIRSLETSISPQDYQKRKAYLEKL